MPLTSAGALSITCLLGRELAQVGRARRLALEALPGWGLHDHSDLVGLVVTELVTNALRHGEDLVGLRLGFDGSELRIEVHDHSPGRPVRRDALGDDEEGRGLALVDGFLELYDGRLGVIDDDAGPGKTVFVTVPLFASPCARST